jgi:hypothetical protein
VCRGGGLVLDASRDDAPSASPERPFSVQRSSSDRSDEREWQFTGALRLVHAPGHVAGTLSMLLAKDPRLGAAEAASRVVETADGVGLPYGIPRLNACRALGACP